MQNVRTKHKTGNRVNVEPFWRNICEDTTKLCLRFLCPATTDETRLRTISWCRHDNDSQVWDSGARLQWNSPRSVVQITNWPTDRETQRQMAHFTLLVCFVAQRAGRWTCNHEVPVRLLNHHHHTTTILQTFLWDHPGGRHSIQTNQWPPPPSPHIFYRPDALPAANQQCQSTEGNQRIRIREKTLEFSSTVLPAPSPYLSK